MEQATPQCKEQECLAKLVEVNNKLKQEILKRKETERMIHSRNDILELFGKVSNRKEYFDSLIKHLKEWSECRCVGIRVLDEEGSIPYESYVGFSHNFWETENLLSVKEDSCACIRVITGRPEPEDATAMTKGGSFRLDNSVKFSACLTKNGKSNFRYKCVDSGFLSIAIVPIRYRNKIVGSIHFADEREGIFSLEFVEFVESLTSIIGDGIHKFNIEDKIQRSNELLMRIFDSTHFGVAYLDTDFNFIRVNQTYGLADERTPEYFIGKNHFDLYPNAENEAIFRKVIETGKPYSGYAKPFVYPKNPERGTTYWDFSLQPVKDNSGEVEGLIFCLVDVTERKRAEEELMRTQKELSETKRLSDIGMLAATIAHELRNPLGVIRIAAYNIKRKAQNQLLESHLANIEKKIAECDHIINNLLFYSRIKTPTYEQVRIYDIINECIDSQRKRFGKIKVSIAKKTEFLKRTLIEADPLQMRELFNNILSNGFEAMQEKKGKIEVRSRIDAKENNIEIAVSDNGVGIEKEILERIFDPFFTTKSQGTGLGLSVCYHIVNLHNGKIKVDSARDVGTTFTVTLPLKRRKL